MDGQLQSLIDSIDMARDERSIRAALKNFAAACGFDHFAYFQASAAEISTLNNYPANWQNLYLENEYARLDPVITNAKRQKRMFAWSADDWSVRSETQDAKRFRFEATDYGICSGVSIPVKGSFGDVLMLTLSQPLRWTRRCKNKFLCSCAVLSTKPGFQSFWSPMTWV